MKWGVSFEKQADPGTVKVKGFLFPLLLAAVPPSIDSEVFCILSEPLERKVHEVSFHMRRAWLTSG
jgi:hypothetical protein